MIKPPPLKHGDRIALLAPGRKVSAESIADAVRQFQSWGLEVVRSENIHSGAHGYLSGSDEQRLADFQRAIEDPAIRAIIAARGGYGSTRFLDQVDFRGLINSPKWIVGFSDVTAIHLACFKAGVESVHGTMPILFSKKEAEDSIQSLREVLFSGEFDIQAPSTTFNRHGEAQGVLVGGNLSLIGDSLGSRTEINTEGCILVIEEIDEYFYRLDRMITQLRRAGKFNNVKGLVVGHTTNIHESELPFGEQLHEIIFNAVGDKNFPVVFGFPSGHENPNLAWIHGAMATLRSTENGVRLRSARLYQV